MSFDFECRFGSVRVGSFGNERPKRSGQLVSAMPKVGASLVAAFPDVMGMKHATIKLGKTWN